MDTHVSEAAEIPPVSKKLLRLVYSMGVILLLLFFALVAGIIYKARNPAVARPRVQDVSLALPAGADIRSATTQGDRLTITTDTEVYVVDVASGRVLLHVKGAAP